ncbi:proton-conducting transporter membrane subunit [Edaphovirga cremea]|uniref:proton-conducting transporter transmembrane domain-containing protein n=1 Tax=Edaphovirga cremea TaxID=2267246 RepID=UPI00398A3E98
MNLMISSPLTLLGFALVCYLLATLVALAIGATRSGTLFSGLLTLLAAAAALLAGTQILFSPLQPPSGVLAWLHFPVEFSALNALLLITLSLTALFCGLYALPALLGLPAKGRGRLGCLSNLFVAAMTATVVADNALSLLILIEILSLCAYFLIIQQADAKSIRAGLNQFLFSRVGTLLLVAAFAVLFHASGTMQFSELRTWHFSPVIQSVAFLLALGGFGILSGIIPLHGWVPQAHSSAPAHISALMSSAMMKVGIFGIIKIGLDLLGAPPLWWGLLVLLLAAMTAFIGGLYALMEHDIKRLLAYHTLENIGIILLGIGGAMVGVALHAPLLASLALIGGLFHLLNHSLFKGALFLGAGEIERQTGIKDLEKMGGLARLMPWTAISMLIALFAMAALPPLNGFASEWMIYQSLFSFSAGEAFIGRLFGPLLAVALAVTGALAVMCVAKVFGVTFLGTARTPAAANAGPAPWPMTLSVVLLAMLCLVCGIGAPWIIPVIANIAASLLNAPALAGAAHGVIFPGALATTWVSPPLIAVLLLSLPLLPIVLVSLYRGARQPRRVRGDAWACGYGHETAMVVTASGFAQPLKVMFAPLYRLRTLLAPQWLISRVHSGRLAAFCRPLALIELAILLVVVIA